MRQLILQKLVEHPGKAVSGEALAHLTGLSRVAIWKHVEALKQAGYNITGIRGQGYILRDWQNVIDSDRIQMLLNTRNLGDRIYHVNETKSTNTTARQMILEQQVPEGTVIIAARQTGGRGRQGRKWHSPVGGLWFSVVLFPRLELQRAALLSLVMAVAVARGLEKWTENSCQIKWPNDIFINGHKVGGILLELSGELDGLHSLIVGVGINVNNSVNNFSSDLRNIGTSLVDETGSTLDLNEVIVSVIESMEKYYDSFLKGDDNLIMDEFRELCLHLGKEISIDLGGRRVKGVNTGIDINGSLLVDDGMTEHSITTGDVHLI
ncbi:biotin--[acetyl-CoA-carboxylase] ligase [Syntrophomonas erecta subsp. sporosyntropha]